MICSESHDPLSKICYCGNVHDICIQTELAKNFKYGNLKTKINPYKPYESIKGLYKCGGCSKGVVYELKNKFKFRKMSEISENKCQVFGWTMLSIAFLFLLFIWIAFAKRILSQELEKPAEERVFFIFYICFAIATFTTSLLFVLISFLGLYEGYLQPNYSATNIRILKR